MLPAGDHDLVLAITDLASGRETGRAHHRVTMSAERSVNETTWAIQARFDRTGPYLYRFLADDELLGFTTVEVVAFPR